MSGTTDPLLYVKKKVQTYPKITENQLSCGLSRTRVGSKQDVFLKLSLNGSNDPLCCRVQLEKVFHVCFPIEASLLWKNKHRKLTTEDFLNVHHIVMLWGLTDVSTDLIKTQIFFFYCHWTVRTKKERSEAITSNLQYATPIEFGACNRFQRSWDRVNKELVKLRNASKTTSNKKQTKKKTGQLEKGEFHDWA